jgi:pyruvate-formate lyase
MTSKKQQDNLVDLLDGYFDKGAHHLNVNVLTREKLLDAQKHPDKYPQLTVRISGYAVRFTNLSKAQQNDIINRTFHDHL